MFMRLIERLRKGSQKDKHTAAFIFAIVVTAIVGAIYSSTFISRISPKTHMSKNIERVQNELGDRMTNTFNKQEVAAQVEKLDQIKRQDEKTDDSRSAAGAFFSQVGLMAGIVGGKIGSLFDFSGSVEYKREE
jgi:hypothetical protein